MLKEFLEYVKENKSPNTFKTYSSALIPFDAWLRAKGSCIEWADTSNLGDYLRDKPNWNMNSGIIFLQCLKSYANFSLNHMAIGVTPKEIRLNLMNQQKLNQIKSYQYPQNLALNKKPKIKAVGMSIPDLEKFFAMADRYDKLVAYILLYFALRKNELFEIGHKTKLFKVDYTNMKATFRVEKRKGYVTKTLDFDEKTKNILMEYEKVPPLSDVSGMNYRFKRYDKQMGYRIYPHLMRHVAISHMRRVIAPLYPNWDFLIKHISGHKQTKDMTNLYTDAKIFEQELKEIMTVNHWLRGVKIQW